MVCCLGQTYIVHRHKARNCMNENVVKVSTHSFGNPSPHLLIHKRVTDTELCEAVDAQENRQQCLRLRSQASDGFRSID